VLWQFSKKISFIGAVSETQFLQETDRQFVISLPKGQGDRTLTMPPDVNRKK